MMGLGLEWKYKLEV